MHFPARGNARCAGKYFFLMQEQEKNGGKQIVAVRAPSAQNDRKQKYEIVTDTGDLLPISEEERLRFSVTEGRHFSEQEWEGFVQTLEQERAYQKGLELVLFRKNTARQVYEKLQGKAFSPEAARLAVERLQEAGYVDDERYAQSYLRQHGSDLGTTLEQHRQALRRKGVSETVLDRVFAELEPEDEDAEVEKLKHFMNNKYSKLIQAGEIDYNRRQKIQQALYRKGYSPDAIQRAVREIWG